MKKKNCVSAIKNQAAVIQPYRAILFLFSFTMQNVFHFNSLFQLDFCENKRKAPFFSHSSDIYIENVTIVTYLEINSRELPKLLALFNITGYLFFLQI